MAQAGEIEVWSGGVNTWECDSMGHLNVRFYVAKSMEGLAGLAAALGMTDAFAPRADATLMVREQHIRFLREARPGASLSMTGGVVELGETDARILLVMRHLDGQPAATFQTVVAHVTGREGRPFPWTARNREAAEALAVPLAPEAAARSLDLGPVETRAGLARAEDLGLKRIGLGVIGPQDCDALGRMRAEQFMGRISDGIPRLFGELRSLDRDAEGRRIGGAALEYRLVHHDWPRAGERVELRSGVSGVEEKVRRLTHWMLDPDSGRPWASAEAVVASFDLDARKLVTLPEPQQAAWRAQVVPGLTL